MHQKLANSVLIVVVVLSLLAVSIQAYPSWRGSRQKRVSDQRLAELQTLLALARLKGKMSAMNGKYNGFLDPAKIGRKKRSQDEQAAYESNKTLDDRADYESRSDDERGLSQEEVAEEEAEDVWRYLRRNNRIR